MSSFDEDKNIYTGLKQIIKDAEEGRTISKDLLPELARMDTESLLHIIISEGAEIAKKGVATDEEQREIRVNSEMSSVRVVLAKCLAGVS